MKFCTDKVILIHCEYTVLGRIQTLTSTSTYFLFVVMCDMCCSVEVDNLLICLMFTLLKWLRMLKIKTHQCHLTVTGTPGYHQPVIVGYS